MRANLKKRSHCEICKQRMLEAIAKTEAGHEGTQRAERRLTKDNETRIERKSGTAGEERCEEQEQEKQTDDIDMGDANMDEKEEDEDMQTIE